MSHSDFKKLVQELKGGQNEKLKQLFQENSKYCIGKLVYKFRCTREDAEDIYTDSVLNLRDRILDDKIDMLTDIRAYLFSTCRNMLLNRFKKEKRVTEAVAEIFEPVDDSNMLFESEDQVSYQEGIFQLTVKAMGALPEKCQALLRSFYFEKLSFAEIAIKYNMANANVVGVSKSRCFQKLLKIIESQKTF
jgi:RNA polymerase sigma factor (sigma-70 family)